MKTNFLLLMCILAVSITAKGFNPHQVVWSIVDPVLTSGDLPKTSSGQMIWGDYNNDGHLDAFLIAGQGAASKCGLYKNNGNDTFTEVITDIFSLSMASAIFIDYNNDGNLDILTAGSMDGTNQAVVTIIYKNSGAPNYTFTEDLDIQLPGVSCEGNDNNTRYLEAVDYNNDGWMDILINGNAGGVYEELGVSRVVALFKNVEGTFTLQKTPVGGTANFRPLNGGSIHFGDVNNDGFADFIQSGYNDELKSTTDLYINNKNGGFTHWLNSQTTFRGHMQGETFFTDLNNDGWNDIVEVGRDVNNGWAHFANIYINNKDNTFTTIDNSISKLIGGGASVGVGDINNDGWVDLLFSGWGTGSTIFYNNGDNTFTQSLVPDVTRARGGSASFVDFNGDKNLDYAIFGYRDGGDGTPGNPVWPNNIVQNKLGTGISTNTSPVPPTGLMLSYSDGKYTMTWEKSTDDFTPQEAIRYNVYIQYKNGTSFSYCPVDLTTGKLKVGGITNLLITNSYSFVLPKGDYTFGVQAVDQANVGSSFNTVSSSSTSLNTIEMSDIKVYVAENKIHIKNGSKNDLSYSVLLLNGQMIHNGWCSVNRELILTDAVDKGVYIVKLESGLNQKIIKVLN